MKVIVKDMTEEIIKLNKKSMKKRNFVDTVVFLPAVIIAHLKNKCDQYDADVWLEINKEFPEYKTMHQEIRKDNTIVFREYTEKD